MKKGAAIHITGIVQGVGFRPWVWKTATELGLTGTVRNGFDGVHIELFGDPAPFLARLRSAPPPLAKIAAVRMDAIVFRPVQGFQIVESDADGEALQQISPDISVCDDCRRELADPADRRHRYPFINCVNCGPRFSIIERLPYDRPQTSMRAFALCDDCRAEYGDPASRRYHAQPIACPACGPQMEPADWETVWKEAMESGRIVAVKGIGGFHLACDALNREAVALLRSRKSREAKPFALMVPDLDWVRTVCAVSAEEERLLRSRERPIVLLRQRSAAQSVLPSIAPGLDTLGVMLPYSPMHEIMFERFPHPVVMTSANYTSEPMIHTSEAARRKLAGLADLFLTHNRDIVSRCDDSVCAVFGEQTIVLRPGRGIAPASLPFDSDKNILAFGADMKNTFALSHHGQITLHPFIGDLEHPDAQQILEHAVERELDCFRITPELVVHDLHPDYFSTRMALAFAQRRGLPAVGIQHHHAHLAGAMLEHGLAGPAVGFAFDGTGYGTDGTIWGGEVLLCDRHTFTRAFHLWPFALPGGEAAVKDPKRAAAALIDQIDPARPTDLSIRTLLASGINCPMTSSMGRLFDAVSCLLGVCTESTFDGEAAMRLEAIAARDESGDLAFDIRDGRIDWRPMLRDLLEEREKGVPPDILAARFHNTVAEMIYCCGRKLAGRHGRMPWVFSGGVFQNRLLVERIKRIAGADEALYFSSYPNDSGLALGQAAAGAWQWASK